VVKLINDLKNALQKDEDNGESYLKIIRLNQLRTEIDKELHRVL